MRKVIETVAIALAYIYFVSAVVLITAHFTPAYSHQVMDTNARDQIVQVKELINLNDRRYEELRRSDALRTEQRFEASEKAILAALTAAKEAVNKAEIAQEKRLDSVNEFRGQLSDQAATFVTRTELYGSIFGVGGLTIGVIGLLLRKRAEDITKMSGSTDMKGRI
jgi:hypothetical protein